MAIIPRSGAVELARHQKKSCCAGLLLSEVLSVGLTNVSGNSRQHAGRKDLKVCVSATIEVGLALRRGILTRSQTLGG